MPLSEKARNEILAAKSAYPQQRTAILPALRAAQRDQGYLGPDQVYEVAEIMELDPNAVQMLVTFYDMLYRAPQGKYVLGVCKNVSCFIRGADGIIDHLCAKLNVPLGGTTQDGLFTVRPFECLAACGGAPAVLVNNEEYHERLTVAGVDALLEQLRSRPPEAAGEHGAPWGTKDA